MTKYLFLRYLEGLTRTTKNGIKGGVSLFHLGCRFTSGSNLNQITLADSRALARFLFPGFRMLHEIRPERIQAALGWFGRMDRAAFRRQKMALFTFGLTEPENAAVTDHVPRFKLISAEADEFGGALQVIFGKVNKPFRIAASNTPGLAAKAEAVHLVVIVPFLRTEEYLRQIAAKIEV